MADATQTVTQQNAISSYAQPYVENLLGQAQTLTGQAYQPYSGQRTADFTNLQNQSFTGAQNLGPASQLTQGTDYASQAGIGSLGVANNLTSGDFQQNVNQYMNPYMKQVLDPQMAELRRQYGITGAQQAGAATQNGAFGGSRDAIMASENNRNLGTAQNQAIGQAYNNAFNMAQNQYNTNTQNRLAGYGQANQAANTMGQLGQTQFGQQQAALGMQNQYGQQQQQQQQNKLNQQYQDFMAQKQDPYNKLSYMQGMLTGLPLTSSIQNVYSNPSAMSQITGLATAGAGAYGLANLGNKLFKTGGSVKDLHRPAGLAELAIHRMG